MMNIVHNLYPNRNLILPSWLEVCCIYMYHPTNIVHSHICMCANSISSRFQIIFIAFMQTLFHFLIFNIYTHFISLKNWENLIFEILTIEASDIHIFYL